MGTVWINTSAAARHRQRMLCAEEEEMTPYTSDELNEGWEFKIVRAITPAFRDPAVLNRLIEEEARAGWVMLEKFDDQRIRFKRPHSARDQDARLPPDVDPYRTHYGAPENKYWTAAVVAFFLFFIPFVILAVIYLLVTVSR